MDWVNKFWALEDKLYNLKRKVDNKQSKYKQHMIGSFRSNKMQRPVYYESLWGECLLFYILELDPTTIRYYEQPVEIPIYYKDEKGKLNSWIHVPDVLIFKQGMKPILSQIKVNTPESHKDKQIKRECMKFCERKGWLYKTVVTKELPEILKKNTMFLWNYKKERDYYQPLVSRLLDKIDSMGEERIMFLAQSLKGYDQKLVIPVIFYMIARGFLAVNLFEQINKDSFVKRGSIYQQLSISAME
ncbi:PDDEXK family nuclease [Litchfieldia alkalitelluris]|uniref:hypothetical protein n=1 Tax=Litchfieldia alkalitelluris TaxID=304268 RepID=UPI000997420A|nr:hypothetical protein [Litchfieldia alkalitelluris]